MAARSCSGYFDQEKGADLSLDLQGLAQSTSVTIKDQKLVVGCDHGVPIGALGVCSRGCAIRQDNFVWQGGSEFRRETHDKHDEDS